MTVGTSNQLIKNLEAENLTASEADRAFNIKWIQLLREAQAVEQISIQPESIVLFYS